MLRSLLVLVTLAAAGCAGDAPSEASAGDASSTAVQSNETAEAVAPVPAVAADVDTTGAAEVTVAGTTVPRRAVVTDIESGDRSCYVTLRTDAGATTTVYADYSLCDTNGLMNHRVQIDYAPDDILASSCDGDPECLETETVALAVAATPIGGE